MSGMRKGRRYLDLTAAFGVAAAGHANPRVVRAGQKQMARLLHAMGDVHPHALKAQLARELSRITFERWGRQSEVRSPTVQSQRVRASARQLTAGKTIFCNSGFEAVEAALKTALLATGKPGVIAFEGAYHGLGYGALNATQRAHFRSPFRSQLRQFGHFVPFPEAGGATPAGPGRRDAVSYFGGSRGSDAPRCSAARRIGAVLVEPVQVRGGINVPPPEFLPMLRRLCDEHQALLILDEIYTGFGRTGKWFACEHSGDGAGRDLPGQGADGRLPALGLRRARRPDGRRLAAVERRGDPHQHVPGPSRRLRDGAGADPGDQGAEAGAAQRRARQALAGLPLGPRPSPLVPRLVAARPGPAGGLGSCACRTALPPPRSRSRRSRRCFSAGSFSCRKASMPTSSASRRR